MMSKSSKKSNDTIAETFKDIIPLSFGEEIGNLCISWAGGAVNTISLTLCGCT